MTTRTPPAVRRGSAVAAPGSSSEARLVRLLEEGLADQKQIFSQSEEEQVKRVREQTLRVLALLSHGPQSLLTARAALEEIVEALSPTTLPVFLSSVLATGEAYKGDGGASSLAQRECVRVLGEVVALHGSLCGRYYRAIVEYIVRRLVGEARERGRSTFASSSPSARDPLAARSGSTEKMQLQCAESLQLVVNSLPPPRYPLRTVVDPLLELFSKRHSLAAPYTQHSQQGAGECLEAVLYAESVGQFLVGASGDGIDGADCEAAGEQGKSELRKLVNRVLALLKPRSRCLHSPLFRLLITLMRETDAMLAVGDCLHELMARAVQGLSAVPGAGHVYDSPIHSPSVKAEYWKTRQEAANLLAACATLLPPHVAAPYTREITQYLSQCKHDKVRPVRDAVGAAVAAWENIRQYLENLQRPERAVRPHLAYAKKQSRKTVSRVSEPQTVRTKKPQEALTREETNDRGNIRQFIKERRQSLRGSPSPVPHVVLVPRSAPPVARKAGSIAETSLTVEDERTFSDDSHVMNGMPCPVRSPRRSNFSEDVLNRGEEEEEEEDDWLAAKTWSPRSDNGRPFPNGSGTRPSSYVQVSPAVQALAPPRLSIGQRTSESSHSPGWEQSPAMALLQDVTSVNLKLKSLYLQQIALVDSIARDTDSTGEGQVRRQQRELQVLQEQVSELMQAKRDLGGSQSTRRSQAGRNLADWLDKASHTASVEEMVHYLSTTPESSVSNLRNSQVSSLWDVLLVLMDTNVESRLVKKWLAAVLKYRACATEDQADRISAHLL